VSWGIIMRGEEPGTDMKTTRPIRWRVPAMLAVVALGGAATACQNAESSEVVPTGEVAPRTQRTAPRAAGPASRSFQRPPADVAPRATPDLLADLEGRVGPQTKARLADARDAGRAFAQRLGIEGGGAQGLADVFTELAFEVAQAEQDTSPGSEARAEAVGVAAQNAFDGVRSIVPATALPEAEREIGQQTGGVPVTLTYPSAARARASAPLP
jgi:hypothetical protein